MVLGKIYFLLLWVLDKIQFLTTVWLRSLYFLGYELRPTLSSWGLLNCWAPNSFSSSSSLVRAGVDVLSCLISLTHFSSFLLYALRISMMRMSPSRYSGQSPHLRVIKCSHTCKVLSSMYGSIIHRLGGLANLHLLLLCLSHWFIPLNWISAKSHLFNEIISSISAFSITPAQYINFNIIAFSERPCIISLPVYCYLISLGYNLYEGRNYFCFFSFLSSALKTTQCIQKTSMNHFGLNEWMNLNIYHYSKLHDCFGINNALDGIYCKIYYPNYFLLYSNIFLICSSWCRWVFLLNDRIFLHFFF